MNFKELKKEAPGIYSGVINWVTNNTRNEKVSKEPDFSDTLGDVPSLDHLPQEYLDILMKQFKDSDLDMDDPFTKQLIKQIMGTKYYPDEDYKSDGYSSAAANA